MPDSTLIARHLEALRAQLAVYRALCELLDERLAALLSAPNPALEQDRAG